MENERPCTILIIDDDANIINLLVKRLSHEGFNVTSAKDGRSGIECTVSQKPDLILLDLLMPEVNGKEVLKELKSNPDTRLIPVIIVSAVADTEDKIDGLALGANDYIVKPFRFQEVIARINTQLRISSMQKELEQKHNELLEKNKLLKKLAVTDPLTGLFNKGYLLKRLRSEISRSARYSEPLSGIMIDIDYFKKLNDTYGHLAGDEVLRHVSRIIKEVARNIDIVTRYGGEEFFIICPNTTLEGVTNLADRIRETVQNTSIEFNEIPLHVTISIGVKCIELNPSSNPEELSIQLIHFTDKALYAAKEKGRNTVVVG